MQDNAPISLPQLCELIEVSESIVQKSLEYWTSRGIFMTNIMNNVLYYSINENQANNTFDLMGDSDEVISLYLVNICVNILYYTY